MDKMTAERALDVLLEHNEWRRGVVDRYLASAKEIGEAIDFACAVLSAPTPDTDELTSLRARVAELESYNIGLATESHELQERVAELEADAGRLDYLSRNNRSVHAIWAEAYAGRQVIRWSAASDRGDHTQWKKTIRQAIDAARLREGGEL